jgi:hypothetical protein
MMSKLLMWWRQLKWKKQPRSKAVVSSCANLNGLVVCVDVSTLEEADIAHYIHGMCLQLLLSKNHISTEEGEHCTNNLQSFNEDHVALMILVNFQNYTAFLLDVACIFRSASYASNRSTKELLVFLNRQIWKSFLDIQRWMVIHANGKISKSIEDKALLLVDIMKILNHFSKSKID